MDQAESRYGVSNIEYDIITTLSNLLQGQEVMDKYAKDAEAAGDQECATIFHTLRDGNRNAVQQLRSALGRHMSGGK